MMTSQEHRAAAEKILERHDHEDPLAVAQVHATLCVAEAVAEGLHELFGEDSEVQRTMWAMVREARNR